MAQNIISKYIVRHSYLTRAVLIAVTAISLLLLATIPFFENASSMSKKITSRRKEAKDLADKVTILSGLDENVLDDRVKILDQALPPRKDVVLYLSTIDGLSHELSLNFGGISLAPGEVTEASLSATAAKAGGADKFGLQTLETEIKITGSQENIYSFLRLLEQSAPLMQIKDAKVSVLTADSYSLALRLGMLWAQADSTQVKGQIALFDDKEEKYFQSLQEFRRYGAFTDTTIEDTGLGKTDLFLKPASLTQ